MTGADDDRVRLDKWLWAARFFKTRTLAQQAISGGKVHLGGARVKPGRTIGVGAALDITRGEERFEVTVAALAERRGPASAARTLYQESAASVARREREAEQRRDRSPAPAGRPDKRDRRRLIRTGRGD